MAPLCNVRQVPAETCKACCPASRCYVWASPVQYFVCTMLQYCHTNSATTLYGRMSVYDSFVFFIQLSIYFPLFCTFPHFLSSLKPPILSFFFLSFMVNYRSLNNNCPCVTNYVDSILTCSTFCINYINVLNEGAYKVILVQAMKARGKV